MFIVDVGKAKETATAINLRILAKLWLDLAAVQPSMTRPSVRSVSKDSETERAEEELSMSSTSAR